MLAKLWPKMFQISDSLFRALKVVIMIITSITIISLMASYVVYVNRLTAKESMEKLKGSTNKDAYEFARFIAGIGMGVGVGARLGGIYATYRENFFHTLIYGGTLLVLLLCAIIGVVRLTVFDVVFQVVLIILVFIFANFIAKEEPFSKDVSTLPL